MNRSSNLSLTLLICSLLFCFSREAAAQKQEVGLTLGGLLSQDRTASDGRKLNLSSGVALQADYQYRFLQAGVASFSVGAHLLANPQRSISSPDATLTRDVATLYIVPGITVKLFSKRRFQPWATIGGGYADYEQSKTLLNGLPNSAPRELSHGVLSYGGGVDVPVWRFVALRGEVRDFYTGNPAYNVPLPSAQHNVVAGGGIVFRFGAR